MQKLNNDIATNFSCIELSIKDVKYLAKFK